MSFESAGGSISCDSFSVAARVSIPALVAVAISFRNLLDGCRASAASSSSALLMASSAVRPSSAATISWSLLR